VVDSILDGAGGNLPTQIGVVVLTAVVAVILWRLRPGAFARRQVYRWFWRPLLHPSQETAATIIASETRLVAAHSLYTLSWLLVLLGLPGLCAAHGSGMGRLGVVGFLTAFAGTYL
jgi:hypothetical protein